MSKRAVTLLEVGSLLLLVSLLLTALSKAQVSVNSGQTVPLYVVLTPVIAALIGLLVWALRTIYTQNMAQAVLSSQVKDLGEELDSLRRWKHDEISQWMQTMTLDVGLLKQQQKCDSLHRRIEHLEQKP